MFGIAENKEFLKDIGIADATEETKQSLIEKIEALAKKKLMITLSEKLTDQQAEEFTKIEDEGQAYNWLMSNVPDFETIVTNIIKEIKESMLSNKMKEVG